VINPSTGASFATVPSATATDLNNAVAAAKAAFASWSSTPYAVRAACLNKFADLLDARKDEFAKALTMEQGKPLPMALNEVVGTAAKARHLAEIGELKPEVMSEDKRFRSELHYKPRCVSVQVGGTHIITHLRTHAPTHTRPPLVRSQGRRWRHHALELPALHGRQQAAPGHHHGQLRGAQAVALHAPLHRHAVPALPRSGAAGRGQHPDRPR
jgi:hypothetical protein